MIAPILTFDSVIWGALVGVAPPGESSASVFRSVIQSAEQIGGQVSSWGRTHASAGSAPIQAEPEFSMTSSAALLHELRTPLTASGFALDVLERGEHISPNDDSAQRAVRTLRMALDEAIHIMQWWEEARKKGHIKAHVKPIAVEGALRQALALSAYQAGRIHVNISDETPLVLADELMLNRIFLNLIENAFLHGQSGGTLDVSTSVINGQVGVRFLNEGVISDMSLRNILLPTPKEHTQAEDRGHGYGLGIVKALLLTMNGSLQVESDERQWTAFTVTLPAALPERAAEM
jgi:two-component system sensor histidine kinase KdpD